MSKYDNRWTNDHTVMFFSDHLQAGKAIAHFLDQGIAFDAYTPESGWMTIGVDTCCFPDADPIGEMMRVTEGAFEVIQKGPNA